MNNLTFALLVLILPVALYFIVIRPKGSHMLATYRKARDETGSSWAGVKAVLAGFPTWWASLAGAVAYALPELLTVASGLDFKELLPDPWGAYVATAMAFGLPLIRAFMATPSGTKPSGEA